MQRHWYIQLNRVLRQQGQGVPVLVLDQASLDANIAVVKQQLPAQLQPRLVVKSLTCLKLIAHIAASLNCSRFMVFHAPHLPIILREFAQADILLGKPMPVAAVRQFYSQWLSQAPDVVADKAQPNIQWLVDSAARLEQYLALAKTLNLHLRINIEIDIGLHRGGLAKPEQLESILSLICENPQYLQLAGLMGYDAHVGKIPGVIQSLQKSYQLSQQRYQAHINFIKNCFPQLFNAQLCFNGAGSPTFSLHCQHTVCNDISFGSMLLKPTDFDIATLTQLTPALFIATPVLKVLPQSQIPGLAMLDKLPHRHKALFVYGGNWLANYVYPQGIQINSLYGRSSNQEMVNVPKTCNIQMDDYVLLRPTQSEAVIGQFSQLYCYDGQQLLEWATFND